MNRKKKRIMVTVTVILFFLIGGIWYIIATGGFQREQEIATPLIGVFEVSPQVALTTPEAESEEREADVAQTLVVYVCGAVNQPGIYELSTDGRLYEAITLAGGFSADADPAYHNLARTVSDGERIYILSVAETKLLTTEQKVTGEEGETAVSKNGTVLINLNTATAEQLTSLPGIGEAKAAAILEYRKKVGRFTDTEEIMNVNGIGEAMYEKIKDKITVK